MKKASGEIGCIGRDRSFIKTVNQWREEMCEDIREKIGKPHICIRIFKDDQAVVTDEKGKPIPPVKDPKPLVGPANTYPQALWFNINPTCVWINGKLY